MVSVCQEIRSKLGYMVLFPGLSGDAFRGQPGLLSSEGLSGLEELLLSGSFIRLASWCWLPLEGLSSLPYGLLHRAAWVSSQHGGLPPLEQVIQGGNSNVFYDLVLEITHCHFHGTFLVPWVHHDSVREGTTQGYEYQGWTIIESHLAMPKQQLNKTQFWTTERM